MQCRATPCRTPATLLALVGWCWRQTACTGPLLAGWGFHKTAVSALAAICFTSTRLADEAWPDRAHVTFAELTRVLALWCGIRAASRAIFRDLVSPFASRMRQRCIRLRAGPHPHSATQVQTVDAGGSCKERVRHVPYTMRLSYTATRAPCAYPAQH